MPFRGESKIERKIGEEIKEEIEPINKEIKEKYPEIYEVLKEKIENYKRYTLEVKEKYPELPELKELNKYAREGGFKEVLITKERIPIDVIFPFNYLIFPERYFPPIRELKSFAPDFLEKGIKSIFGSEKERVAGHEREHFRGRALEILKERIPATKTLLETKISLEIYDKLKPPGIKKRKDLLRELKSAKEKIKDLEKAGEQQAETQRILRYSKSREDIVFLLTYSSKELKMV